MARLSFVQLASCWSFQALHSFYLQSPANYLRYGTLSHIRRAAVRTEIKDVLSREDPRVPTIAVLNSFQREYGCDELLVELGFDAAPVMAASNGANDIYLYVRPRTSNEPAKHGRKHYSGDTCCGGLLQLSHYSPCNCCGMKAYYVRAVSSLGMKSLLLFDIKQHPLTVLEMTGESWAILKDLLSQKRWAAQAESTKKFATDSEGNVLVVTGRGTLDLW